MWELVDFVAGDITRIDDLYKAFEGVDTVFHTVSPAVSLDTKPSESLLYAVNVLGTQNVIEACIRVGVRQLIYTSSASVVFDGTALHHVDETQAYPAKHLDPYSETKAEAERCVLEANGRKGLLTVSLRPSGLFGPHDTTAWPGFLKVAREGKSRVLIGDGTNQFDWSYIENVAQAHLLAMDRLTEGSPVAGSSYFITNDEPTLFWSMADYVYSSYGYPKTNVHLPYFIMLQVCILLELIALLLGWFGFKWTPIFNRFRCANSAMNRTFSIEKAKKELGYKPHITLEEAKERTLKWFKENRR
ncbi:3beta-hydroxysteroid dehydrogenase [Planoprotostelium fungivorum]|uniref:3beta-hydroxysteroid dehydrogenase n=1 Tax=Planoprotostelium fungivorum TaxID=1890364 RepID=A0A2P6NF07_9EUKA|nr:3beta-hydroxysteroid dehydrogenase [Planoprotostelium fungivorum]